MRSKIFSFNWSYGKQNLKANAGIYMISLLVLPLLMIPSLLNQSPRWMHYITLRDLAFIPGIYVWIMPMVLALVLYGFLFSRKQVDFVGSLPINRRCIFWTNYWIGIGILVSSLLLTVMIISLVISLQSHMIVDSIVLVRFLIFYSLCAFFTFSVMVFAIACTGNRLTALLLAITLICLPSTIRMYQGSTIYTTENRNRTSYIVMNADDELYYRRSQNSNSDDYVLANMTSVHPANELHPVQLSICAVEGLMYTGLAYVVFKRRKLEVAQTTFMKQSTHDFVRSLIVFTPLYLFIGTDAFGSNYIEMIFVILIFVLFYLYDITTHRTSHSFKRSLCLYFVVIVVSIGIHFVKDIHDEFWYRQLGRNDVQSITVEVPAQFRGFNQKNRSTITIDDPKFIDAFFDKKYVLNSDSFDGPHFDFALNTRFNSYRYSNWSQDRYQLDAFIMDYLLEHSAMKQKFTEVPFAMDDVYEISFFGNEITKDQLRYILELLRMEEVDEKIINHYDHEQNPICTEDSSWKHGICQINNNHQLDVAVYENGVNKSYFLNVNVNEQVYLYLWNIINQQQFEQLKKLPEQLVIAEGEMSVFDQKVTEYYLGKEQGNSLTDKVSKWLSDYEYQPLTTIEQVYFVQLRVSFESVDNFYQSVTLLLPVDDEVQEMLKNEVSGYVYD